MSFLKIASMNGESSRETKKMNSTPQDNDGGNNFSVKGKKMNYVNLDKLKEELTVKEFLITYFTGPWVLVKDGSLNGYFDFIPAHLRTGPWCFTSRITVPIVILVLVYTKSEESVLDFLIEDVSSDIFPSFSMMWWLEVAVFLWMAFILGTTIKNATAAVACTFT